MAHRSRLRKSVPNDELECIVCGCTEENACILPDGTSCSWITPGLCSHPECLAEMQVETQNDDTQEDAAPEDEAAIVSPY